MKLSYKTNEQLVIFRIGKSSNGKISDTKTKIVQQYSFSIAQYEYARNNPISYDFFNLDCAVCFDCPMRGKKGKCYTHKFGQLRGFYSMLRSLPELDKIPKMPKKLPEILVWHCTNKYVRFGTYGEPILVPLTWVSEICKVASSWTGYTHRWRKDDIQGYSPYFMASTEDIQDTFLAMAMDWLVYQASEILNDDLVNCPASKESGYKSNCAKCGLCSGTKGKGKKSVNIIKH